MIRQHCSLAKQVGVYSLVFMFSLFLFSPSITLAALAGATLSTAQEDAAEAGCKAAKDARDNRAEDPEVARAAATAAANSMASDGGSASQVTAASKKAAEVMDDCDGAAAAMQTGKKVGMATDKNLKVGTIAAGVLIAAAVAGIAASSGGKDVVLPVPIIVPPVTPPTPDEEAADLIAITSPETEAALATLLANQTQAETDAFSGFVATLTSGDLTTVKTAMAGGTGADLTAVAAALASTSSAGLTVTQQAIYDGLVTLTAAQQTAFITHIQASSPATVTRNQVLFAAMTTGELAGLQTPIASDQLADVIEAILENVGNDPNVVVTVIHHGNEVYTTIYHR